MSISIGKCFSHFSSLSSAAGHSVQKSEMIKSYLICSSVSDAHCNMGQQTRQSLEESGVTEGQAQALLCTGHACCSSSPLSSVVHPNLRMLALGGAGMLGCGWGAYHAHGPVPSTETEHTVLMDVPGSVSSCCLTLLSQQPADSSVPRVHC